MDSSGDNKKKNNFSNTFNLLSQYLKDNPTTITSLLDRSLSAAATATGGMGSPANKPIGQLGSIHEKEISKKKESSSSQMTIFYRGQVIVLDDFPHDKATEIINLADNWNATKHSTNSFVDVSHLPIARKASLARFLHKRKERITARAPYQGSASPSKQDQEQKPTWLGIAAAAESKPQS